MMGREEAAVVTGDERTQRREERKEKKTQTLEPEQKEREKNTVKEPEENWVFSKSNNIRRITSEAPLTVAAFFNLTHN